MLELGTEMVEFALRNVVDGEEVSSEEFDKEKPILIIFMCRHCPYVEHVADKLGELSRFYEGSVTMVGISSNDVENYPEDSPENLREMREEYDFEFPILYDVTQEVAIDFTAACTPDFFLFDKERKLAYRGQFDDSRPGNKKEVTGRDLKEAIEAVLAGKKPKNEQKPSSGCNIKWKVGNEPPYYK
jgi:thiol-disulfide isomerase/thioredoxin